MLCPSPSPLYNLSTWKLNHGQAICDTIWGAIGNILGYTLRTWGGNILGIWWEYIMNKQETKKIKSLIGPTQIQNKEYSPPMRLLIGCMKFLFPKRFVTIFKVLAGVLCSFPSCPLKKPSAHYRRCRSKRVREDAMRKHQSACAGRYAMHKDPYRPTTHESWVHPSSVNRKSRLLWPTASVTNRDDGYSKSSL